MYQCGLDLIENNEFKLPNGCGGLITNMSAVSSGNNYSFDIIPCKYKITKIFAPEHGLFGVEEAGTPVKDTLCNGIPVISLYGEKKAPAKEDLLGLDYLVFDIQDIGLRIYTYLYTLSYCLEAAKQADLPIYILDRPNPMNGTTIEGNILNIEFSSFIGRYPIPQRYGLSIGEFAGFINRHEKINAYLTIVPLKDWSRNRYIDEYSNNFHHSSPNLPTFESILNYAATSIFEGTNISEGRGTTMPFLIFGAPWIDEEVLLKNLRSEHFKGVEWRKTQFVPNFSKYRNELCHGARLFITDRNLYTPIYIGLRLIQIIKELYPNNFTWQPPFRKGQKPFIEYLTGDNYIYSSLKPEDIKERMERDSEMFKNRTEDYKIYA